MKEGEGKQPTRSFTHSAAAGRSAVFFPFAQGGSGGGGQAALRKAPRAALPAILEEKRGEPPRAARRTGLAHSDLNLRLTASLPFPL